MLARLTTRKLGKRSTARLLVSRNFSASAPMYNLTAQYNDMLSELVTSPQADLTHKAYAVMKKEDIAPNGQTYTILVKYFLQNGDVAKGLSILANEGRSYKNEIIENFGKDKAILDSLKAVNLEQEFPGENLDLLKKFISNNGKLPKQQAQAASNSSGDVLAELASTLNSVGVDLEEFVTLQKKNPLIPSERLTQLRSKIAANKAVADKVTALFEQLNGQ
eukprot:TRINITY_DN10757_c0_g1_i1.p1 TRINITY_DN10757_c0_g1~~TRINITY_DN10757_c0_g1_i1.p1  ORF type:complete len:220 (-),score=60.98 TRINITY_DN10757_c0_g1_i1:34-693(-)